MQSTGARTAVAIGSVALIAVLFVLLAGGSDDGSDTEAQTTQPGQTAQTAVGGKGADGDKKKTKKKQGAGDEAEPQLPVVRVEGGQPVGGVAELEFEKGTEIAFEIRSDTPDEIHVHGYDLYADVADGSPARFSFDGDLDGIYEIELHGTATQIAELRVTP